MISVTTILFQEAFLFFVFLTATSNLVFQRFNINMGVVCMHKPRSPEVLHNSSSSFHDVKQSELGILSKNANDDWSNQTSIDLPEGKSNNSEESHMKLSVSTCSTRMKTAQSNISNNDSEFSWSSEKQGTVMAAFYYGIAASQLPSAWFVDKLGARRALLLSQFIFSILSLVNPISAKIGAGCMFFVRFLQGALAGPTLLSTNVLTTRWCGSMERGFLLALTAAGFSTAAALVYPISAFLCENIGWRWIFYFPAATGLLWCFVGYFMVFEWPEEHPTIQLEELQFIQQYRAVQYKGPKPEVRF